MALFLKIPTCLLLACLPIGAFAFGSKRFEYHSSTQTWSQSLQTLLNGVYSEGETTLTIDPTLLGQIQTGPLWVLDGKSKKKSVILTTIDGKRCKRLEKKFSDLGNIQAPTSLRSIRCEEGEAIRTKAQAPNFAGYHAVSVAGKAILESFYAKKWQASREIYIGDSEDEVKRTFSQSLSLRFEDDLQGLDIFSEAEGLNRKSTDVMREAPLNRLVLKRLLEQKLADGTYRFLVWGEKIFWPTNDQRRVALAAINPELMNKSDRLTVYPNSRVCLGAKCWKMGKLETAKLLYANYLVIEFNPAFPSRLRLQLVQVDLDTPEVEIHYGL